MMAEIESDLLSLKDRILEYSGCNAREEYSEDAAQAIVTIFVSLYLEKIYQYQLHNIDDDKRAQHQVYFLQDLRILFKNATGMDIYNFYKSEVR